MPVVTIVLGIVCLGLVVMVHEFGHYLAGRALGVEVEAFSIGWGPKIASFKRGGTEWRVSAFPLGGYCKFRGEESFRAALERKLPEFPKEKGSFYGAAPWRRIVISVAGPLANVILAILIFTAASTIAYSVKSYPNRIILASEYNFGETPNATYPADEAGLKSGDRIVAISGKPTADYTDILEIITRSPGKPLELTVERNGALLNFTVTPRMRRDGTGYIGISNWVEPIVSTIRKGDAADIAGFMAGDRIRAVDGSPIKITADLLSFLNTKKPERVTMTIERSGTQLDLVVILDWKSSGQSNLGIGFQGVDHRVEATTTISAALAAGLSETWDTFATTLTGLGTLFKGVDVFAALSGPARIISYAGESVAAGIEQRATGGLAMPLNFLGFLSVALFIMNLLPIPALDGGQIVMHGFEVVRRKPLKPVTIYRYQLVGVLFILGIFVLATVGDLLFFTNAK